MINLFIFLLLLSGIVLMLTFIASCVLSCLTFQTTFRGYNIKCANGRLKIWKEGEDE